MNIFRYIKFVNCYYDVIIKVKHISKTEFDEKIGLDENINDVLQVTTLPNNLQTYFHSFKLFKR